MMKPRKQTVKRDEPQTVAAAEAMLKQLQAQLERHTERGVELEAARKQASFGAHALHDPEQRKALDDVVDEAVRHETEGRAIADAIEEAKRRLVVASAHEAAAADRARAEEVLKILGAFREAGRILDGAALALGVKGNELLNLLGQLHGLGIRFPSLEQVDVFGDQALKTAIAGTPWAKRYRIVAPNERKSFGVLVDGRATMIEQRIRIPGFDDASSGAISRSYSMAFGPQAAITGSKGAMPTATRLASRLSPESSSARR
jgi:hypothetical protein